MFLVLAGYAQFGLVFVFVFVLRW